MSDAIRRELNKDSFRENLLVYTRRAFKLLPPMDCPRVLDIGCGSGVPTLELARLTNGTITAIDVDQEALDELSRKVENQGLDDRITISNRSLTDIGIPDSSLDLIWAEGSIAVIGFSCGLKKWRSMLAPGRFLVVHDETGNIKQKCEQVSDAAYELIDHFIVSTDTWWEQYFVPLKERIEALSRKYSGDKASLAVLKAARREVSAFEANPERNCSAFFIMQKLG